MNQSPNSLRDMIRIENSDLGKIGVVEIDGNHYVTESSIVNFMNDYDIDSKPQLIESLIDFNNISEISILDENTTDDTLVFARDIMMLCEDVNPFNVVDAANGRSLLRMGMVQMVDIITRGGYTQKQDIDKYIKKCDNMLEDIREEKKNVKEKNSLKGQTKFSCMFLFNICKTVFLTFVVPISFTKKIKWPAAISKLFIKNGTKAVSGFLSKKIVGGITAKTAVKAGLIGIDAASSLPPDIKGLYLSITNYEKLLNEYEHNIRKTKESLIKQKNHLNE